MAIIAPYVVFWQNKDGHKRYASDMWSLEMSHMCKPLMMKCDKAHEQNQFWT